MPAPYSKSKKAEPGLTRKAVRAGGFSLAKRLVKPIPVVGSCVAVGLAGYEIRRKGLRNGLIHVGLDLIPVVGTAKGVVELFTGDWLPDREKKPGGAS
ncbi:MAG TPA: hypothetical protein VK421_04765 [Pyrinomonadaceae bacterium]|nr:hypothetical protein [Pyrinomonadaceae bacterium]